MLIPRDKPWALFSGDTYYPEGGPSDFTASFATRDEAMAAARSCGRQWATVCCIETGEIIELWTGEHSDTGESTGMLTQEEHAERIERERRERMARFVAVKYQ